MNRFGGGDGDLLSINDLISTHNIFVVGTLFTFLVGISFFAVLFYGFLKFIFIDPFSSVAAVAVHLVAVCSIHPAPNQFDFSLRDP